jgi:hypothetical protein
VQDVYRNTLDPSQQVDPDHFRTFPFVTKEFESQRAGGKPADFLI